MGTWGVGIFDDDLTSDVRGDWRDAIADGLSPADATAKLLRTHGDAIADTDEASRFWMGLAAAQAATGRLQDDVRDEALKVIDRRADVEAFMHEDPAQGRRRQQVIAKLASTLRGPQRPPTRISRPTATASPVAVGDVVRVKALNGSRSGYFVVVALADGWPPGSTWPVVAGLAWDGDGDPTIADLGSLPLLRDTALVWPEQGPVVDLHIVNGPSRGPRAWSNVAEVIAHGVARPDAPDPRRALERGGPNVAYMSWRTLAEWIGGEWHERRLSLTREDDKKRRRWTWWRR